MYPWIKATESNLSLTDTLFRQTVQMIALMYGANCSLWVGLENGTLESVEVYATAGAEKHLRAAEPDALELADEYPLPELSHPIAVQKSRPARVPGWLQEQWHTPHLVQLDTGELIVPVLSNLQTDLNHLQHPIALQGSLQFVLILHRAAPLAPVNNVARSLQSLAHIAPQFAEHRIQGWSNEELESIAILCHQFGLAYSALYWRQQFERSRQRAALVGRIIHLLNSSLNPDEIVRRIVAELGLGFQCDRAVLVDLRDQHVNVLALWEQPETSLHSLNKAQADITVWQTVLDLFLQGGASHLQVISTDADTDPLQGWLGHLGAKSALMVPLSVQEEFFGVVCLLSYNQQRVYELDDLQTVRQVANQAAIALTNAQHYQTLWHKQEALRLQNNSLQLEIIRDELTQLMNRRSLERELEQLSTKAVWAIQTPFSVIVCDIDYFKLVNDTYGHLIGDEVLQDLAHRLQKQLRRETPAYRYGGEEFVVILAETALTKAVDVAERLRQAIRATPMVTNAGALDVTASFGVAQQSSMCDQHAWDVLHRADKALYDAKRQGRDRVIAL
ncbi:sensor domain-containing diguanylate cyclase [Oculatella sp. LEGE 06141]|uniref:GGDEF domain-containing protein n=1 Tax=Oculatella sp. LEGE 06141 TaxID=1828648 RepID=UPI001882B807|nr:sensor domain-containing diguanylate cyclase [Oculatella sp. LEGE 06141]MBE9179652.1 sensor domain-containing diguanylate cyclase [Oculatella sp. LEGE 06141]